MWPLCARKRVSVMFVLSRMVLWVMGQLQGLEGVAESDSDKLENPSDSDIFFIF
jgi:hypothetical protein